MQLTSKLAYLVGYLISSLRPAAKTPVAEAENGSPFEMIWRIFYNEKLLRCDWVVL